MKPELVRRIVFADVFMVVMILISAVAFNFSGAPGLACVVIGVLVAGGVTAHTIFSYRRGGFDG